MAPRRRRQQSAAAAAQSPRRRAAARSPRRQAVAQLTTTTPVDRRVNAVQVSLPNDLNAPTQAKRYITHIKQCMEYVHKKQYPSNHKFHEE